MLMLGQNLRSGLSICLLDDDVAAPCSKVRSKERNTCMKLLLYLHVARSSCKPLQTASKPYMYMYSNAPRLQSDLK